MVIDRTLSGPEVLVALINSRNPGKNLTVDQVTFGTPTPIQDHPSEENTSILVYPVTGKGYGGDPEEFYYSRMIGNQVKQNPPAFIVIENGEDGVSIRNKVAVAFNVNPDEMLISDAMLTDIADSQYRPSGQGTTTCVLSGKPGSLLYLDFNSGYQLVDLVTPEYPGAQ
jgi:hypothetical protein